MLSLEVVGQAPVASLLFIITILTSIIALSDSHLLIRLLLNPYKIIYKRQYYRLLTSGWVHANSMHLFLNMFTYFFFAFVLEIRLGHWQFALLYIASLIISDLSSLWKYRNKPSYNSLGASGAVSALVLSLIILMPTEISIFNLIPGWVFGLLYIVMSYLLSIRSKGNISHESHLWGAISGVVLTLILKPSAGKELWEVIISQ